MIGRYEVCTKQPSDGRLLPGERRRRIVYGGLQTLSEKPFQSIDVRRQEPFVRLSTGCFVRSGPVSNLPMARHLEAGRSFLSTLSHRHSVRS